MQQAGIGGPTSLDGTRFKIILAMSATRMSAKQDVIAEHRQPMLELAQPTENRQTG